MINVMFVCHGNICRSPMAEFVFKDMVDKKHLSHVFYITSSGTSCEELGNPVHRGTKKKLLEHGISSEGKKSVQFKASDYAIYNYIICMDQQNVRNLKRIIGDDPDDKIKLLLMYTGRDADIADPWYTGNFDLTYDDVVKGCEGLLQTILKENHNFFPRA